MGPAESSSCRPSRSTAEPYNEFYALSRRNAFHFSSIGRFRWVRHTDWTQRCRRSGCASRSERRFSQGGGSTPLPGRRNIRGGRDPGVARLGRGWRCGERLANNLLLLCYPIAGNRPILNGIRPYGFFKNGQIEQCSTRYDGTGSHG